ncbi:hypothetical protein A9404_07875 [Halothiobacillus diazotrophicus]|uniref:Uncharacterized protein n=1 Tax=Halothiobacillus diazotrophicus TaxID=1860122 RepID=A0A191ZHI5_9GAMM|nr:hypothetical protein [Halothiobacillus diazotrophicus]ANJ67312.1 hypothetical protein A9404_07875 [Halothiobacillus diazotrophicus]
MTGREVIDVLERFFVLEWFRVAVSKSTRDYNYPPVMAWRYAVHSMKREDITEAEEKVATAVRAFQGKVDWVVWFSGKNWVLLPARVKELEDSGLYLSDSEIVAYLGEMDPEFGVRANNDLPMLAKFMSEYLMKNYDQ